MKTFDFTSNYTAEQLNESMFKKFGQRINFDKYTREQLEDYRNLLRTKINQSEMSSNFNELLANETYQKDKYMVGVLNTRIKEMLGESKQVIAEKSKSKKQARTMAAAAHDPAFAKKVGIKTSVAKEFNKADTGTKQLSQAMKKKKKAAEGIEEKTMKKTNEAEANRAPAKKSERTATLPSGAKVKATKVQGWQSQKADKEAKFKESEEKRAPAKKSERTAELPSGAKVKATKVQGWQSQKADKEAKKARDLAESKMIFKRHVRIVNEGLAQLLAEDEEGKAKTITAASDMVNDFTSWMQRVGQYQTKSMIELADEIRAEFGPEESEAFKNAVAPALAATLETLTSNRETISHAVAVLAGEATDAAAMGQDPSMMDPGMDQGMDMEPEVGGEEVPADDGMQAGTAGAPAYSNREMRESREATRARKLAESHNLMRILSK